MGDHAWRSRAGWSQSAAEPAVDTDASFEVPELARYELGEVIGAGGMGEVVRAFDQRLQRDIAIKRMAKEQTCAARFAREAWITARLDHPSIVPIYDAGVDEQGQPFYAMRLIHGRTLEQAIRSAAPPAPDVQLLRHFLAAAHAVAFAHSRGVVHRDLKPSNIMVGGFGETLVVDWGLAIDSSAQEEGEEPNELAAAGTPGYMSPEQRRGERVDARSDVWALGAILYEVIHGEPLHRLRSEEPGTGPATFDRGAVLTSREGGPRELVAIVAKATAERADQRYVDAGQLANDVAKFLDGRRVTAHEYSTWELMARTLRRLRWPITAAAVALIVGGVALAFSYGNIRAARNRAVVAEQASRTALSENRKATSWALAQQAVALLQSGAVVEAEHTAAMALVQHDSPLARGVIAATAQVPKAHVVASWRPPDCHRVLPHPGGHALCLEAAALSLWENGAASPRWRRDVVHRRLVSLASGDVAVLSPANELQVLSAAKGEPVQTHPVRISTGFANTLAATMDGKALLATEGRVVTIVDVEAGRATDMGRLTEMCGVAAVAADAATFWVVCTDGDVLHLDPKTPTVTQWLRSEELVAMTPVRADVSGDLLVVGGVRGDVLEIELASRRVGASRKILHGPITQLLLDGPRVWLADDSRGLGLYDRATGFELLRLPLASSTASARFANAEVVTGGDSVTRWGIPADPAPRSWSMSAPIASFSLAPGAGEFAIGRSDGRVEVRDRRGHLQGTTPIGDGVVKTLHYGADGQRLAISVSTSPGVPVVLDVGGPPHPMPMPMPLPMPLARRRAARRLLRDASGELIGIHWKPPLSVWSTRLEHREVQSPEFVDASRNSDGTLLWLLAVTGELWSWRGGQLANPSAAESGATLVAAFPKREAAVVCRERGCVTLPGPRLTFHNQQSELTDIAVSPDERYVVGGRLDGTMVVWRTIDAAVVAILHGHRERVGQLDFAADGRLYSAGWDGQFLSWDLGALDRSGEQVLELNRRAWPGDPAGARFIP